MFTSIYKGGILPLYTLIKGHYMKSKPSTILISSEHHNKLKELAAYDKRTIRAYIEVLIDNLSLPTATSSPAPAPAYKLPEDDGLIWDSRIGDYVERVPSAPAQSQEDFLAEWADD